MTVRLAVSAAVRADPGRVWSELTDWAGQSRWIPFTTVRAAGATTGIGVRVTALSGFWLARLPVGLLDRFIVTDWRPPDDEPGRLEVLHLGPYFTGPGVFTVVPGDGATRIECVELFDLPAGRITEVPVRLLLPVMRRGFGESLRRLAAICES
ncbi:SRPBCC family protein [Microlunatus ginsengisoli]|uniref:Polyketide cyclase / dehydrase and lipid transport n=1 Tax=Microlunatus ginsengisoli TaxID=363863 RepID=A0ABP7ATL2_9ACTN